MLAKPDYCRPCPLYGDGSGFSYLEGTGASQLTVVAEALGSNEHKDALPLRPYAKSGGVFQRVLDDLHIDRDSLTITNILRCQPINNELLGAPYERAAIDHCRSYLDRAVANRKPRVVLALGAIPLRELAPEYTHLSAATIRGFTLPSRYEGVSVIGTYHPSYIARGMWHLYGVLLHDTARALQVVQHGPAPPLETHYELLPTVDRVEYYYRYLLDHPELDLAYDVETAGIFGEKEPTDWKHKRIVQIQFSHRAGFALVLPYEGQYRVLAQLVLSLPNRKLSWNGRTSDEIVLRADGCVLGGEQHDLMLAWGHLQPDFAGGKDEHEEKGIPTRLMGLQSCASFFCPDILPWKHDTDTLRQEMAPEQAWVSYQQRGRAYQIIAEYGAKDVCRTQRCGVALFDKLRAQGLYDGYMEYKYRLRFVLDDLGARGLPVDRTRQQDLAAYVVGESHRIETQIQDLVPLELRNIHPTGGFKSLSSKVRKLVSVYDPEAPPLVEYSNFSGYLVRQQFVNEAWDAEERWCVRKLFNPNSPQQLLAYIKYMGYPVPRHIDTKAETTNAFGLETLVQQTGDLVLKLVQQQRKLTKLGGTYAGGDWVPGDDDRVHPTFGMLTGSGQTTAKAPNVQQYPQHYDPNLPWLVELMKKVKGAIKAEQGRVFVKVDARAFHARMQGFLAEDAAYYRLASLDCHSFVTAHYVGVPDKDVLLPMEDGALLMRLKEIKRDYEYERNYMVKRISFLNQYLGGAAKAATILRLSISEVQFVLDTIADLFPKAFKQFPEKVKKQLGKCRVSTPFGCHRFVWDRKIQEGVASIVANSAHCHVQSALIRLYNQGVFEEYSAVNFAHDSLWLHPKESQVDEVVRIVKAEMERPSTVLVNSLGAFQCLADAEYGPDMNSTRPL